MRTRRSPRNQDRLFAYLFKPEPAKPVAKPTAEPVQAKHLEMTDAEIDKNYMGWSSRSRSTMKREAKLFQLRKRVAEALNERELLEALSDIIDDAEESATAYAAANGSYHRDEQAERFARIARARAAIAKADKVKKQPPDLTAGEF